MRHKWWCVSLPRRGELEDDVMHVAVEMRFDWAMIDVDTECHICSHQLVHPMHMPLLILYAHLVLYAPCLYMLRLYVVQQAANLRRFCFCEFL